MRIALLLIAALLAGCGSDDGDQTSATSRGGSVELSATEFAFDPSSVHVDRAGTTTFTLTNNGELAHALEIEGQGIEEETDTIDSGATTEITVDLEPGEYEFYCPVDDHRERGMEGTLVVGGGAGGTGTMTDETTTEESNGYGG